MLAEDLAQETFVKAYRNLAAFDTTRRLSSWLFRIAHNTAVDALRRQQPAVVSLDARGDNPGSAVEAAAPAAADPVEREALGRAIADALERLRPEYRAAISLRYDQDLSFDEIGQIMGCPSSTVKARMFHARARLRSVLSRLSGETAP